MDTLYFKEFIDFLLSHNEMQILPMAESHRTDQTLIGLLRNPELDTGSGELHIGTFWPDPVTGRFTVLGEWASGNLQKLGWDPEQDVVIDVSLLQVYQDFISESNVSAGAKSYWQDIMSRVTNQTTSNAIAKEILLFLITNYNIDARNVYVITVSNDLELFDQIVEWDHNID